MKLRWPLSKISLTTFFLYQVAGFITIVGKYNVLLSSKVTSTLVSETVGTKKSSKHVF